MKLIATFRFDREFDRIIKKRRALAQRIDKTLTLFSTNPNHPSLRLHKLSGGEVYSLSVTMDLRILLEWQDDQAFLLRIGTHEEVY
ncbi:plasmid stabilization protein [Candidatus Gottesmanbacteria bacterium]|nr:plasmid stabilization protein [Candidatus Gottesmanbacteria bacterium]